MVEDNLTKYCQKINNNTITTFLTNNITDIEGESVKYNIPYFLIGMHVVKNTGGFEVEFSKTKKMKIIFKKANPEALSSETIQTDNKVPLDEPVVIISAPNGETSNNIGYSPSCGWYGCNILENNGGTFEIGNSNKKQVQTVKIKVNRNRKKYNLSSDKDFNPILFCKETKC